MGRYQYQDIGGKIKELRKLNKITQTDLANKLNTIKSAVSNWETGYSSPKPDTIRELAEMFRVSTDYLLGNTSYVNDSQEEARYNVTKSENINVYANIEIDKNGVITNPSKAMMSLYGLDGREYFSVEIKDEAMNNLIGADDLAVIHKQSKIDNNEIALVKVNDSEISLRKIMKENKNIILVPDSKNPNHKPEFYGEEDDIQIIGKLEYVIKKMD